MRALVVVVCMVAMAGCAPASSPSPTASMTTPRGAVATAAACHAGAGGTLPDPSCTPGATDPAVTQADITSTICRRGYTATVRPPASVTEPIKRDRMRAYGITQPLSAEELDHLIPLELGGATTVANLWPEPRDSAEGAHVKDRVEDALNHAVCSGSITLAEAQLAIVADWRAAGRRYGAAP